jgi:hypothetical protein
LLRYRELIAMQIRDKRYRRLIPLLWCLGVGALLLTFSISSPTAQAQALRKGHLEITNPLVNGNAQGRAGTTITLKGNNFDSNDTIHLYYTTNGDSGQCTNNGDPGDHGLQPFTTNATINAQDDGAFTQDVTWPDAANTPNTQYYVCALSDNVHALTTNSFTIMQSDATFVFSPNTLAPGGQVPVTGTKWLPPQTLTVSIGTGNNTTPIVSQTVTPGADGNFSVQLTIPDNAQPGTYNIFVVATGDATLKATKSNALTITQATPTPQPTTAPSPTVAPTPTPTATTGNTGGGGNALTMLIYALGGIGVILVIVGVVMFAAYSRP